MLVKSSAMRLSCLLSGRGLRKEARQVVLSSPMLVSLRVRETPGTLEGAARFHMGLPKGEVEGLPTTFPPLTFLKLPADLFFSTGCALTRAFSSASSPVVPI